MHRKLNLNAYAGKILAVVVLFLAILPGMFGLTAAIASQLGSDASWLYQLARLSLLLGAVLASLFLLLVIVELIQDWLFDRWYRKTLRFKLPIPGGGFECPFCGSRKIRQDDQCCPACGKEFAN